MGYFSCCGTSSKTPPSPPPSTSFPSPQHHPKQNSKSNNLKHDVLFHLPKSTVHLMDGGEATEIAHGEFMILQIKDEDVPLAKIIRVGDGLRWPLTKDEPVVKLDSLHYLFSLPMKDGEPLSYGVTFQEESRAKLGLIDSFLKENSCFNGLESSGGGFGKKKGIMDWEEYAPRVENYNHFLARAIAGGTGQIIKGIFQCSNAYTNQVQNGGETILTSAASERNSFKAQESYGNGNSPGVNKSGVNQSLKRVRKLSEATEKISKTMLDGVGVVSGSMMAPVVKSQAGKAFLAMLPGEVLLASLDAVNKLLDAAEVAEKQTLSVTSNAATRMVTNRFGEGAGEATKDALATAGHVAGTAWNVLKIRKAMNPASSVPGGVLKTAAKDRKTNY